ncbi:hypothetical protein HID58_058717, partial [Brassica napus]
RVRVNIIRLWKLYSCAGGLTIEMVLIDSSGDKIHVGVKKDLVNLFDSFLAERKTLTFTNFFKIVFELNDVSEIDALRMKITNEKVLKTLFTTFVIF